MRIAVRLFIVSLLAAATSLQAITYIVPNDRDLVKRAEAIVIATAVESHSELRDGGRLLTVATKDAMTGNTRYANHSELTDHEGTFHPSEPGNPHPFSITSEKKNDLGANAPLSNTAPK